MSFYTHPYAFNPSITRAHQAGPFSHPSPRQQYNFFATAPAPPTPHFPPHHAAHFGGRHLPQVPIATNNAYEDYEAEERAALLHLRDIQRRRELASQIERQKQIEVAREAAIKHELDRRQALREEYERQIQARHAAQEAYRQEVERRKVLAIQQAIERREKAEKIRRVMEERKKEYLQFVLGGQREREQEVRQTRCAANCARRSDGQCQRQQADQIQQNKEKDGFEELNGILGALFGVNLSEDKPAEQKVKTEKKKEEQKQATGAAPAQASTSVPRASTAAPSADKTTEKTDSQPEFPENINEILQSFLGLRVDPAKTASDKAPPAAPEQDRIGGNGIPAGLNELLGQFGLVFEPDTPSAASEQPVEEKKEVKKEVSKPTASASASSSTTPAAATKAPTATDNSEQRKSTEKSDAPLTAFLNGLTDLPPFVRDILENVEVAFKEEANREKKEEKVKGKGKGVADGEKKARSCPVPTDTAPTATASAPTATAPTPTSPETTSAVEKPEDTTSTSLSSLVDISSRLESLQSNFTFPPHLSFSSSSESSSNPTPALLFNKHNATYHSQAHSLLQLLLAADSITSAGNKDVRRRRKEVVRQVEGAIEELERKRDELWIGVKERREKGEVSDWEDEEEGTSETSSSAGDHEEKPEIDHQEDKAVEEKEQDVQAKDREVEVLEGEQQAVEGFEVPARGFEEAPPTLVDPSSVNASGTHPVDTKPKEEKLAKAERKTEEEHRLGEEKKDREKNDEKEDGYELL